MAAEPWEVQGQELTKRLRPSVKPGATPEAESRLLKEPSEHPAPGGQRRRPRKGGGAPRAAAVDGLNDRHEGSDDGPGRRLWGTASGRAAVGEVTEATEASVHKDGSESGGGVGAGEEGRAARGPVRYRDRVKPWEADARAKWEVAATDANRQARLQHRREASEVRASSPWAPRLPPFSNVKRARSYLLWSLSCRFFSLD
jgi:hypothetical protein